MAVETCRRFLKTDSLTIHQQSFPTYLSARSQYFASHAIIMCKDVDRTAAFPSVQSDTPSQ